MPMCCHLLKTFFTFASVITWYRIAVNQCRLVLTRELSIKTFKSIVGCAVVPASFQFVNLTSIN